MAVLLDALRSVEFLALASEECVVRFMVLGRGEFHRRREVLWRMQSPSRRIVIPVSGTLKCVVRAEDGREFVPRFADPGECVGLTACLGARPYATEAVVTTSGEFFSMSVQMLRRFLEEWPDCGGPMRRMVAEAHARSASELVEHVMVPVRQRLARLLLNSACMLRGDGARVLLDVPQADVAARLGTVREVVARHLGVFTSAGLVERTGRGLVIRDWDGLRAVACLSSPVAGERDWPGSDRGRVEHAERYFLPIGERGHCDGVAAACSADLGSLARCRAAGCPAALRHATCARPLARATSRASA